jgi:hypothetical protein
LGSNPAFYVNADLDPDPDSDPDFDDQKLNKKLKLKKNNIFKIKNYN